MKTTTLTRKQANRLHSDPGDLAERIASQEYQGYRRFGVENFDVSNNETGKLGEVKSTPTKIGEVYKEKGRFRLWKTQHEKLLRADREGSARYVFVLFDVSENPPVAYLKEKIPSVIGHKIGARGGWYDSGHNMGKQYKLPIDAVFR